MAIETNAVVVSAPGTMGDECDRIVSLYLSSEGSLHRLILSHCCSIVCGQLWMLVTYEPEWSEQPSIRYGSAIKATTVGEAEYGRARAHVSKQIRIPWKKSSTIHAVGWAS
jgi:hypothetical protein